MEDLAESVNKFLGFNEFRILDGKGKISSHDASKRAFEEYDKFNKFQVIDSDFDKFSKELLKKE
jgi:hypothetical protein